MESGTKMKKAKPGDIIQLGGIEYYVFKDDNGNNCINAVNESWIDRGLRYYGEECYPLNERYDDYAVIDHYTCSYPDGTQEAGEDWYINR